MIKIEFATGWEHIFETAALKSFEDFFDYSAGRAINRNKKRDVIAMSLPADPKPRELFMKRFYSPHFKDMLLTLRNFGSICSQAGAEWKNANILLENNIDTYRPVCYGEQMHLGLEKKSFFITEKISAPVLTDFITENWRQLSAQQKEKIITSLARLVRKVHNAKISFPDLYLWHLFLTKTPSEQAGGDYEFALIDLHRMRINVRNKNEQIKNLAALDFSMSRKYFDDEIREVFLDAYTADAPGDKDLLRRKIKNRSEVLNNRRRKPDY